MRSFFIFLQARDRANVPDVFTHHKISNARPVVRQGREPTVVKGHTPAAKITDNYRKHRNNVPNLASPYIPVPYERKGLLTSLCGAMLLAACGLNGTDRTEDDGAAPAANAAAASDAAEVFEDVTLADSEPRPLMQLQVVLDRQGFGPGVIDGREGLSTTNALKGFQEANDLEVTGELDLATRGALARWDDIAATRVVRIPESWGRETYRELPEEPVDQAKLDKLGYASIDERLAERFHTTVEVLQALNPGGSPAGTKSGGTISSPSPTGTPSASTAPSFRAGQLVRVPNAGVDRVGSSGADDEPEWLSTLASLGVGAEQPEAARVVVDKSEGWLKAYGEDGKLLAMFTVTSGSAHDPLPLGNWKINGISRNPDYSYDPTLLRNAPDSDAKQLLPPGPNSPVGVVWIDLSKEHYGIHGTPDPAVIGRAQSNGCVRLTNWDAARLAGMVDSSTEVVFEA